MAHPIMFSATTTGPDTEKMAPWPSSNSVFLEGAIVYQIGSYVYSINGENEKKMPHVCEPSNGKVLWQLEELVLAG